MGNSFTEEDVKNLQNFLQFVADKAKFKLDMAEAIQLAKFRVFGGELLKKVNDHIFELKKITEPEKEQPKSKKASK